MAFPTCVTLVEVGPRDGLQNEPVALPVATRVALIDRLSAAGLPVIEAGSFVSPDRVPQMAGTAAVLAGIARRPGTRYPVLVANRRGLEEALAAGAREIAVFAAATEAFSHRNLGCSIADSLERFAPLVAEAVARGLWVRGYVSCALGCPDQGAVPPMQAAKVAAALAALGCAEISLGDTIGTGTPGQARALIEAVATVVPLDRLAAHFHDTHGRALANLGAVLEMGVSVVDCSVAGLGGCPFAPGAGGNVATGAVLGLLESLGIETGLDRSRLAQAAEFIRAAVRRNSPPDL